MPYGLFSQSTTAEYTHWPIRTLNLLLYLRNLRYQKNHARVKVSCRSRDPPPTTSLSTGRLQTFKYWITILLLHNWYTCMTQPHIEKKSFKSFLYSIHIFSYTETTSFEFLQTRFEHWNCQYGCHCHSNAPGYEK